MMHNYKFINGNGTVTRVTRSHKLTCHEMDRYMANAGNNVTYTPEQFDRVEQTYKQVAEQLQVDLNQMTALAGDLRDCLKTVDGESANLLWKGHRLIDEADAALREGES